MLSLSPYHFPHGLTSPLTVCYPNVTTRLQAEPKAGDNTVQMVR